MYVDSKIPKIEDVEKVMSSDFNGWVDHGGHWKPTKCKARKKVMSSISSVQLKSSLDSLTLKISTVVILCITFHLYCSVEQKRELAVYVWILR